MNTIKDYILENYGLEEIKNILDHGMESGINGLVYYTETSAFYDQYKDEIWEMLDRDARAFGCNSIFEFITNNLRGINHVGSDEQFKNLLCWYAVEREVGIINELKETPVKEG